MSNQKKFDRRFCLAPMMAYTDRHFRYMIRLISEEVFLYTEMVTTGALIHGDLERHLGFDPAESPVAVQLGGSDPDELRTVVKTCDDWGYDEINLNVGCPSDRVQSGQFGACLMKSPNLVAECVSAMRESTSLPVTVKTRIGLDHEENYEFLTRFVETVAAAECDVFIIHARKAWLDGLSPKENREVPPLRYDVVYQLKKDFPSLEIILNGGVVAHDAVSEHLKYVDGVMIGREAVSNPFCFREYLQGDTSLEARRQVVYRYCEYADLQLARGVPLGTLGKPLLGLFFGQPRARHWRRALSENMHKEKIGTELFREAADRLCMREN